MGATETRYMDSERYSYSYFIRCKLDKKNEIKFSTYINTNITEFERWLMFDRDISIYKREIRIFTISMEKAG